MFKKIFLALILLFITYNPVKAQESFSTYAKVEYKVLESGNTAVTHTITITNNSSYDYAKSYILELSNLNPENIRAYEDGNLIPINLDKSDEKYSIKLDFPSPLAGKGKSRTFLITYDDPNLADHNGEVWEVTIPKLQIKYTSYKIVLSVPASFGQEALISPEEVEKKEIQQRYIYVFDGRDLARSGISAIFGKFQVYKLKLGYYLKNNNDKKELLSLAIPPDTSTQKVYYTKITPEPAKIKVDEDGNWLAYFEILPKKSQDVEVEAFAQVFANPVKFLTPYPATLLANLKPQEYWETEDPQIKEIATFLKTPNAIYDFVTDNLTYNYDRVKPEIQRYGAKKALSATNEAICTEFTDLFIALSRSAGIPAREINGYAHSDNSNLQPLSLIADVLHSWPEYWDETQQNWIPVDPTWESTSNIDYFNKFDLKHIAFVIHGKDSKYPLPAGSYKSDNLKKDVHVEFSTLPENNKQALEIDHVIVNDINIFRKKAIIKIKNTGLSAHYNLSPKISYSDTQIVTEESAVLPPFATHETVVNIPLGLFAYKTPESITVTTDLMQKEIFLNKTFFVTQQLLAFLSILLIFLIYFGVKTKKINVKVFRNKLINILNNDKKT